VEIIDPYKVEPTINPESQEHLEGTQLHRRVLSPMRGGPRSIDIGYNTFKAGLDVARPYAYSKDEFCYLAKGEFIATSRGDTVTMGAGGFMWRPPRAATERVRITKDSVSICAFGPAREDGWSHRLTSEEIDRLSTEELVNPRPIFYSNTLLISPPWTNITGTIEFRRAISSPRMDVSRAAVSKDSSFRAFLDQRDEVWWLDSGKLTVVVDGVSHVVLAGQFITWRSDENAIVSSDEDSVLVIFSAPATEGD
jgi:mannose-6-phosphate isomerase-like protein (cupin superfamily)